MKKGKKGKEGGREGGRKKKRKKEWKEEKASFGLFFLSPPIS